MTHLTLKKIIKKEKGSGSGCYCETPQTQVLTDLEHGSIPDEALMNNCCFKWICEVKARCRFGLSDGSSDWEEEAEAWIELCRKKGYLRQRQNPRGF